jgi:sulfite exporter TauE/SafE
LEYSLSVAALLGIASTLHCLGMCGSIIGALSLGLPAEVRRDRRRLLTYVVAYNLGRIASYALAGAVAGGLSAALFQVMSPRYGHSILECLAAALMLAMGLYLAGWFPRLARLERLGAPLWRRLEPVGRRLLPVRSPAQALLFGMIWGWLPCGLVYSLLIWTASAGSAARGSMYMLAFGLGTLPMVMTAGIFIGSLVYLMRRISHMEWPGGIRLGPDGAGCRGSPGSGCPWQCACTAESRAGWSHCGR